MKVMMKKSLAVLMSFVMIVSVLFGLSFASQVTASAADVNTVNYVYDGSYVYNWGERETEATFLSPMAEAFYAENDIALSELLALNGSSTESGVPSSALYAALHDLMESNHTNPTSYDGTRELYRYTDCENSGSPSTISSFYSGAAIGPAWDGGDTWNREHTWPNSKGDLAGSGENDIMMLRPAATSENGSRSNKAYGESTGYFNPNIGSYDLRGDVARIILYQYVRWECTNTGSSYNPTGIFGTDGVIESQAMLLDWLEADPVDTWELGRNDAVEAITGTRNVFVDYPELGFDLFNEAVPAGYDSPSGGKDVDGSTGSGSGDDNTGDTPSTSGNNIVFELGENGEATHSDGSSQTSYTETVSGYTLNITGGTKFYTGARDATGNSAIKMGTSSVVGSFSMTAPDNVTSVIFKVAKYKANTTTVDINGTQYNISGSSDNGVYDSITVDTTATKDITFTTVTKRCMIDSITYVVPGSASEDGDKVYVDEDSVVISGASSAFAEDTVVTAVVITSGDSFDTANTALADMAFKKIYEITATNGGIAVQPESPLTITLDIPTGYNVNNTYIVYIDESGVVETLETLEKTETTISAQISHFSTYAVVDTSEVSSGGETVEVEATINFDSGSFIETGATAQIWSENGVTVTTNKGTYANDFYTTISDHTRWYNGHEIVTEYAYPISKIVFTTTGTSYTTNLANSLTSSGLGTVTSSGTTITLELTTPSDTITFSHVNSATRVTSMTLTAQKPADGGDTTEAVITPTVNNAAYGSAEVSGNYIIATPNEGYEVVGYEVVSGTANVTQNGNNFTVETDADVTIQINFAALPTYTVQFSENQTVTSTITAYEGQQIELPESDSTKTPDGYEFVGWATIENATSDIKAVGATHIVSGAVTFYAQYNEISDQPATQATITFDDTSKRIVGTTSQQKWVENGVTVTNDKAASSTNVNTTYFNPIRVYAHSSLTIAFPGMTKIEITTSGASYATALAGSDFGSNATVTTNDTVVTIVLASAVDTFVIADVNAQTRLNSITVYGSQTSTPGNEYSITYMENGTETNTVTVEENTVITLPNDTATPSNKNFVGWATVENATSDILEVGSSYTVTGDVTFYAQYTDKVVETATHNFVKVTEDLTDWTGTYLIVYEEGNVAFDGSLSSLDVASNGKAIEITDGKIAATSSNLAITFTVTKNADGTYTIRSKSGFNIGGKQSDANGMLTNANSVYKNSISIDADGNAVIVCTYNDFNNYMRYNATSGQDRFRYFKASSYDSQQPIALYKLDVADITGAQVTIGSDLTMKYYVDVTNIENVADGDLTMRFSIDGEVIDTVTGIVVGSQYVFDFAGLAPQRMADAIKAEVLYKGTLIDVKDNYSIKTNAQNLLTENAGNAELCQFITDMLYYGAAAQKYTKYNTDNIATDGVTGLGTPSTATPTEADKMSLTTEDGVPSGSPYFRAATVWFDSENGIIVKVEGVTANTWIEVDGEIVEIVDGQYKLDNIKVTDFDNVYTFELYEDGYLIQTLQYSINAYAYSKQNSTNANMADLALALFRLGQSAEKL